MKIVFLLVAVAVFAVASAKPQTECEKHRESAKKLGSIMKLIPDCDDDGYYKPLQCYQNSKFCVCYDKNGHPASPISTKITECGCYLKRKEKADRGHDNPYLPQCADDGTWVPKQCWDYNNSCWCVDDKGNKISDIKAGGEGLDC